MCEVQAPGGRYVSWLLECDVDAMNAQGVSGLGIGLRFALLCACSAGASCGGGGGQSTGPNRSITTSSQPAATPSQTGSAGSVPSSFGNAGMTPPGSSMGAPSTGQPGAPAVSQRNAASILKGGCAVATVQSELLPSNLLFVLDRSGSMNCNPPPTTDSPTCESNPKRVDPGKPSKWEITQTALVSALQQLPASTSVGISYFSNDDSCGVSSTPNVPLALLDKNQLAALKSSLGSVTPNGGTPIVGATILAYKHLHALALDQKISGNSFVVLLTDGQQSEQCSDPSRCKSAGECTGLLTEQEVPKAAGPGADIRTFVIGAPGSEPARPVLSQIALKGGTAPVGCNAMAGECHFDMTRQSDFAAALSSALTAITGKTASCELPLPSSDKGQPDLTLVNVVYSPGDGSGARVVPQDKRAACDAGAEGWQYNADSTKIELCGAICNTVRTDTASRLDVVLGCPAQGPM